MACDWITNGRDSRVTSTHFNGDHVQMQDFYDLLLEAKQRAEEDERGLNDSGTDEILALGDRFRIDGKLHTLKKFTVGYELSEEDNVQIYLHVFYLFRQYKTGDVLEIPTGDFLKMLKDGKADAHSPKYTKYIQDDLRGIYTEGMDAWGMSSAD